MDRLIGATAIARWFNRLETFERLLLPPKDIRERADFKAFEHNLLYNWCFIPLDEWEQAMIERLSPHAPLFTGAYIVRSPHGERKLEGVLRYIKKALPQLQAYNGELIKRISNQDYTTTLQEATAEIAKCEFLGDFTAFEIVTDLRWSQLLHRAPDILTWANPGPGAARGLSRIVTGNHDHLTRTKRDMPILIGGMQKLLQLSQNPDMWPQSWPKWEMREVEHTLCEFDKYERVRLGHGRPRQKYDGMGVR